MCETNKDKRRTALWAKHTLELAVTAGGRSRASMSCVQLTYTDSTACSQFQNEQEEMLVEGMWTMPPVTALCDLPPGRHRNRRQGSGFRPPPVLGASPRTASSLHHKGPEGFSTSALLAFWAGLSLVVGGSPCSKDVGGIWRLLRGIFSMPHAQL